jgi:predicted ATP-dependent endonuclease of OLD family
MPLQFYLSKLIVTGFRGIRELSVDLPRSSPLYILGGNNAGKTTLLEAFALALNGGGFHQFEPEKYDFFHDSAGKPEANFSIKVQLAADDPKQLPAVQGVGDPIRVHAIEVRGTTDRNGRFSHRRVLLEAKGTHIL